MIEIEELHKHFGELYVLNGINLSVTTGEVVCIIGPSGSGKSTLLRCVNHLETPESGRIRIDGKLAYPSTGDVIDVKSHKIVAELTDETGAAVQSEKLLEIDFKKDKPVRTGNQFGLGARTRL